MTPDPLLIEGAAFLAMIAAKLDRSSAEISPAPAASSTSSTSSTSSAARDRVA